jgi:hypothetical protein
MLFVSCGCVCVNCYTKAAGAPPSKPLPLKGLVGQFEPGCRHFVDKVSARTESPHTPSSSTMSTPETRNIGVRRARTYKPIERLEDASDDYPVGCSAFLTSIHDARYYQGIMSNPQNFSIETRCDIFHVQDGKAEWKNDVAEDGTLQYLTVLPQQECRLQDIC